MRTASGTARNTQPWSRAAPLPPLDPASRQLERDADATMTVDEQHDYAGQTTDMQALAVHREVPHLPQ
jgi:hypothetical protein